MKVNFKRKIWKKGGYSGQYPGILLSHSRKDNFLSHLIFPLMRYSIPTTRGKGEHHFSQKKGNTKSNTNLMSELESPQFTEQELKTDPRPKDGESVRDHSA